MVSGESGVSTISIHAPTRGATIMDMSVPSIRTNFNPRSHKGSDDNSSDRAWFVSSISIHAPTRGATTGNGSITFYCYISIHAPTRGATNRCLDSVFIFDISIHAPTRGATPLQFHILCAHRSISIHAPTRGATQWSFTAMKIPEDFNPRSHKGSDAAIDLFVTILEISIHAPTRGAT